MKRYLCIVLVCIAVGRLHAQCNKGVFVYLDISGSMYDDRYHGRVRYDGEEKHLIDAMAKFCGAFFSRPGILNAGDRFEIHGFGKDVFPLIDRIASWDYEKNYKNVSELHERLDKVRDGWIRTADINALLKERKLEWMMGIHEKTDLIPVLNDIQGKVGAYVSTVNEAAQRQASVIILTDAFDESDEHELEKRINTLVSSFSSHLDEGNINILLCTFQRTPATKLFNNRIGFRVLEFDVKGSSEISMMMNDIESALKENLYRGIEFGSLAVTPSIDSKKWHVFKLPLRNVSCSDSEIEEIACLVKEVSQPQFEVARIIAVNKKLRAFTKYDSVNVRVDLRKYSPGKYQVEFELSKVKPSSLTKGSKRKAVLLEIGDKQIPWQFIVLGIVLIVIVIVIVWARASHKPQGTDFDRQGGEMS